jgi:hypothetical protein
MNFAPWLSAEQDITTIARLNIRDGLLVERFSMGATMGATTYCAWVFGASCGNCFVVPIGAVGFLPQCLGEKTIFSDRSFLRVSGIVGELFTRKSGIFLGIYEKNVPVFEQNQ